MLKMKKINNLILFPKHWAAALKNRFPDYIRPNFEQTTWNQSCHLNLPL